MSGPMLARFALAAAVAFTSHIAATSALAPTAPGGAPLRAAIQRAGTQGRRCLLQDHAWQKASCGRTAGDRGRVAARAGLGERILDPGDRQDAGRNEEERPRSVSGSPSEAVFFVTGGGSGGVRAAR